MPLTVAASGCRFLTLSPADPSAWVWWPVLMERIRVHLPTVAPDVPVESMIGFIAEMATTLPQSVRWWIACDPDSGSPHDAHVTGHAIGWVDVSWGQPYLLIHQVMADPGARVMLEDWLTEVWQWGQEINTRYAEAGSPFRVHEVRFWSARADAAWDRLLGGRVSHTFHVKHVPLSRLEASVPRGKAL